MAVALELGGEIVNFDSVQIYQGIRIATAKPTADEQQGVPHHLIDYVPPTVNYTAADWASDAITKIGEIEARGNIPILVGGTGFYLRALRQPLFESPKTDTRLRERLGAIRDRLGPEHLYRMLGRLDPASARRLYPRDSVRVIRALEVYFQTGHKLSEQRSNRVEPPEFAGRISLFVLEPPRAELYEKINRRTEQHFAAGLVEEVKQLRAAGVKDTSNALGAHGYRRICEYLRGERYLESAVLKTKQDVRNYAKRQLTWYRRESDAQWLSGFGDDPAITKELLAHIEKSTS